MVEPDQSAFGSRIPGLSPGKSMPVTLPKPKRSIQDDSRSLPSFSASVMADEPQGAIFGAVVAAPAFQQIARFALQYYEVQPDAPVATAPAATAR